jgi:hypothetical protein
MAEEDFLVKKMILKLSDHLALCHGDSLSPLESWKCFAVS